MLLLSNAIFLDFSRSFLPFAVCLFKVGAQEDKYGRNRENGREVPLLILFWGMRMMKKKKKGGGGQGMTDLS